MRANALRLWAGAVLLCAAWAVQANPPEHAQAAGSAPPARARAPSLDLSAPDLARLYPRAQLRYILNQPDADAEADALDAQTVGVQAEHYVAVPLGQLQAIPWAILHPTQAWRIFTPVVAP